MILLIAVAIALAVPIIHAQTSDLSSGSGVIKRLSVDTTIAQGIFPVLRFEHLTKSNGLPNTEIYSMLMDRQGFIWFGSVHGLIRYDGLSFTGIGPPEDSSLGPGYGTILNFTESHDGVLWCAMGYGGILRYDPVSNSTTRLTSKSGGLLSKVVSTVCEDVSGTLWVGGDSGVDTLDSRSGTFQHVEEAIPSAVRPTNVTISTIRELPQGSGILWMGTFGGGLIRYDRNHKRWTRWWINSSDPAYPPRGDIQSLFMSKNDRGILWVGTPADGLYRLNIGTGTWNRILLTPKNHKVLSPGRVTQISESPQGMFFVATMGTGLYVVDPASGRASNLSSDPHNPSSLSHNEVTCTLVDSGGILWAGTYNGVYKANPARSLFTTYSYSAGRPDGLTHNAVSGISEDRNGILWVCTRGGGLNRLDRKNDKWTAFTHDPGDPVSLATNDLSAVYVDRSGNLWTGGRGGWLHRLRTKTGTFDRWQVFSNTSDPGSMIILCIFQDSQSDYWVGTSNGMMRFNPRSGKAVRTRWDDSTSGRSWSGNTRAILEDRNGDLWIGTTLGGLLHLDRRTGKMEVFAHNAQDSGSLSTIGVRSLVEDARGRIWVGTAGGGLNQFDRTTKQFKRFRIHLDPGYGYLNGLLEDHRGRIWASAGGGISAFDPATGVWSRFDESDGIQGDVFIIGASFRCTDGTLCFGGVNGLTLVRPDTLYPNTFSPPILLTGLQLGGRPAVTGRGVSYVDDLSILSSDEILSFQFAVLDYRRPDRNAYLYQMDGISNNWVEHQPSNPVSFHLPPGRYTFRAKGTNGAGVWTRNILTVSILVEPRYWETFWFRSTAIVGVLSFIGFLYRREVNRLKREKRMQQDFSQKQIESQEAERKRLAAELHDGLGQNLLVVKNEIHQFLSERYVSKKDMRRVSSLVQETVESVREISSNLHPRHLERLGFTSAVEALAENVSHSSGLKIDCACDARDLQMPKEIMIHIYRIIQEALSNIVRHASATSASVIIRTTTTSVEVTVKDDGHGFNTREFAEPHGGTPREDVGRGFGLASMSERARIIGGKLAVESSDSSGTTIRLTVSLS